MKHWVFLLPFLWTACSILSETVSATDTPVRPPTGYDRSVYLNPYIRVFHSPSERFPALLRARSNWNSTFSEFPQVYPHFDLGFSYFQNSGSGSQFTFAERLFFADVFDLMRYTVNSPIFEKEILKRKFFENDGLTPRAAAAVLADIRNLSFSTSLAKRSLAEGVLAEATVGGFLNIIWVRSDIDYSTQNIADMAIIILHEVTHNLGYSHPSEVNYGVHFPAIEAIRQASFAEIQIYINRTPYYEPRMINLVRQSVAPSSRQGSSYVGISEPQYPYNPAGASDPFPLGSSASPLAE